MWVYADREINWCIAEQVHALATDWQRATQMVPGLDRHALVVSMLIRAGMIWQAREDSHFAFAQQDRWPDPMAPDRALTMACAALVHQSIANETAPVARPRSAITALLADDRILRTRIPEGYAFYDLYPEFMIPPARRLPVGEGTCVLGLRSIGTSLATMVATSVATTNIATVRPAGLPFDRIVETDDEWRRSIRQADCVAIVDEGPGLSGSSFAAAARAVRRARERMRIIFMPTHGGGPGVAAVARDRAAWSDAEKETADRSIFDQGVCSRADWFCDLIGQARSRIDISGGRWRAALGVQDYRWPAVDPMQERVKILVQTDTGEWLLKFSGLTPLSSPLFADAQHFANAGFGLAPLATRHGMTLWPWQRHARPLQKEEKRLVLPFIAPMLAFRSRYWSVAEAGCTSHDLWTMARVNIAEACDDDIAQAFSYWQDDLDEIAAVSHPVKIDGRLDPHEFLRLQDGRIVKTDALDHHASHDLIGCQDIAWDIAGTMIEWNLEPAEAATLMDDVERISGRSIQRHLLPFYLWTYTGFRIGVATMAIESLAETDRAEAERFKRRLVYYREMIVRLVRSSAYA